MRAPQAENPITRAITRRLRNRRLKAFIRRWDALEALVIRVNKRKAVEAQDETEYTRLRGWLEQEYPHWEESLAEYWPSTRTAGQPASQDPFRSLLSIPEANSFVSNWVAMQTLPAAREALNNFLIDVQE